MDLKSLRERVQGGASFDYLLFWGHRQKHPDRPDASCLSQWFLARFEVNADVYPTAEHWMMACKARLFGDQDMLTAILKSTEPSEAKKLGRRVRNFDGRAWSERRYDLVVEGNVAKFSENHPLRAFLLGTGECVLVEASPRDRIWGIGMGRNNEAAMDPARWRGSNLLGFALMDVRTRLRSKP